MITHEDLKLIQELRRRKRSCEDKREYIRSQILRVNQQLTGMPPSGQQHDVMAEYAAKLDAIERALTSIIVDLEERCLRVDQAVLTLPANEQRIMRLRYVEGYSWKRVAKTTNYSDQSCWRLHLQALDHLGIRKTKHKR